MVPLGSNADEDELAAVAQGGGLAHPVDRWGGQGGGPPPPWGPGRGAGGGDETPGESNGPPSSNRSARARHRSPSAVRTADRASLDDTPPPRG